jgi:uncharacterized protein YbjT (DUF2867 family)
MSKSILVIFGATGNQGNSTAHFVLDDPELSQRYTVRAISRDLGNPKMKDLEFKDAELVQADLNEPSTLQAAVKDVDFLFFLTATQFGGNTREIENKQAKALCEKALEAGVKYIIYSSMSHPYEISGGKLKNVEHFDDKAEIELYIRNLPVKSAFFAPGSFMQNFLSPFMAPRPSPSNDGSFILANCARGDTAIPFLDISDTGKWIGAILADPEKYEGKFLAAAENLYTLDEACDIIEKVTGSVVKQQQLPDEIFKQFLPEGLRDALFEMWVLQRDYGYYGKGMREQVQWAKEQARGKLIGLEEFLRKNDFKLP